VCVREREKHSVTEHKPTDSKMAVQ